MECFSRLYHFVRRKPKVNFYTCLGKAAEPMEKLGSSQLTSPIFIGAGSLEFCRRIPHVRHFRVAKRTVTSMVSFFWHKEPFHQF